VAEPFLRAGPTGVVVTVTIRYFAAARGAAGVPEELLSVRRPVVGSVPDADGAPSGDIPSGDVTVAMVLAEASDRHGPELARVLQRCSFLLDEVAVHGADTVVLDGQLLDVLPPFAGG
jgi:molybdopterin converting factor small subunit